MHVIVLSGLPGSGKSTFAKALGVQLPGSARIDVALVLQSWIGREMPRAEVGVTFVSQFGLEKVPYAIVGEVNGAVADYVIVDAVRHASSINKMRELIDARMTSIFVECEDSVRISRLRSRLLLSGAMNVDDTVQKYMAYHDDGAKSACNFVIENSGEIAELRESAAKFLASFVG